MSLRGKFQLIVAVAAGGLLALAIAWLTAERSRILSEKKEQAKSLVQVAYSLIAEEYAMETEGKANEKEAKRRAIEKIRALRYGDKNYFVILDMNQIMLLHPTHPEMEGKRDDARGPDGIRPGYEFVRVAREQQQGFVSYMFSRPGGNVPVKKISFVKGFEPWGWVVGTGMYIDDLDAAWWSSAVTAAGLGMACLLALFGVSTGILRSVSFRLEHLVQKMGDVAHGKADSSKSLEIPLEAPHSTADKRDEIDVLILGFNQMLAQIEKRDVELRRHEGMLEKQVALRTQELLNANTKLANDMMQRMKAEAELRTAHAEAEQLLSSISSILIGVDEQGRVTRWNTAASSTFGIRPKDALGKQFTALGVSWEQPGVYEQLRSIALTGKSSRLDDVTIRCEDGENKVLGLAANPIRGERGQLGAFVLLGVDITHRRQLEDQLRQAQKLEAIGQLAAGIAHEINTPTQFIGDNLRFLQESWQKVDKLLSVASKLSQPEEANQVSPGLSAELQSASADAEPEYLLHEVPKALEQSLDGVQRVSQIVQAMRDFSHPGSAEKQSADINRAIEAAVTVSRNAWKYVADVKLNLDPNLPLVQCMIGQIQQALLNLLINAAQAIEEKTGKNSLEKGTIYVSTRQAGSAVEIRVEDTGAGIPEEIRNRVFEPFFTTKVVGKGTGQGLALVHTVVVKRHSGSLWIESPPGKGAAFVLQIPLGDGGGEQKKAPEKEPTAVQG